MIAPSVSYSFTIRLQIANRPRMLGRVASAIGEAGFNKSVAPAVAGGVVRAAHETAAARRRQRLDLSRNR